MWKVLCLLGVLAVPLKAHHLPRRDIRELNDREILEKVHYSSPVPIWHDSPSDDFICELPGYFPHSRNCQYFYKCTVSQATNHLFQFVYRCEKGRIYSSDLNKCLQATESELLCAEMEDDESSMEVEDKQTEPNQRTFDEITVKKPSSQYDLTNEGEEKQTPAQNLGGQSDGRAVNAPTEKPTSTSLLSFRSPGSIRLPKVELNVSIEKRVPGFQGIKNMGLKQLKSQPVDDGKEDEGTVPVQNKPPSISEQQVTFPPVPERQSTTFPPVPERQSTTIPPVPERQSTTFPPVPERQYTTLPPIPEVESDEMNVEIPTTWIPMSSSTPPTPPPISETEENRTAATEVQTGKGQSITVISTSLHKPEIKEPADNTQEVVDQSACYDVENSSDVCVDEAFHGVLGDSSKFYRCVSLGSHFVKYELQCPFGTMWDDILKTCNFRAAMKEEVKYESVPPEPALPTSTTPTAPTIPPASSDDLDNDCLFDDMPEDWAGIICPTGFRQHPKYCNMFYQCISSDYFEVNFTSLVCPDDMVFNMELLQCEVDEPRRQSCRTFEPLEKQDDGQILVKSNLKLCPEEGRFVYGERCSSHYIECLRDEYGKFEGYLQRCPYGQLYSSVRDKCRPSSSFTHCSALF